MFNNYINTLKKYKFHILIVLLLILISVTIYNVKEARRLERVMPLIEITDGRVEIDENGQAVIWDREVHFNDGDIVKLKPEFADPESAMENIKDKHYWDLKKIRQGSFWVWGSLANWNWKEYEKQIRENEENWSKGDDDLMSFFDIYENKEDNEETIKNIVNR